MSNDERENVPGIGCSMCVAWKIRSEYFEDMAQSERRFGLQMLGIAIVMLAALAVAIVVYG